MLRELLSVFRSNDAVADMGRNFLEMLALAENLAKRAGEFYFAGGPSAEDRSGVYDSDVKVNKLERRIRKKVVAHLTLDRSGADAPYCLLMMSIVKDVERIGDYSKNLAGVYDDGGGPLPDDHVAAELREVRAVVEEVFAAVPGAFSKSDSEAALDLIRQGRDINRRCDALIKHIAAGPYDAATTTTLVLGTRYYKRIASHVLNVLSGVVMPLHKIDYYDERSLPEELAGGSDDEGGDG